MHPALRTPELCEQIFAKLDPSYDYITLHALSETCHDFRELALRRIWSTTISFDRIFTLLPRNKLQKLGGVPRWTPHRVPYTITATLSASDVAQIRVFGRLVRHFELQDMFHSMPSIFPIDLDNIVRALHHAPLFPNLTTLRFVGPSYHQFLPVLLVPSIDCLYLSASLEGKRDEDLLGLDRFVEELTRAALPMLRRLQFSMHWDSESEVDAIARARTLRLCSHWAQSLVVLCIFLPSWDPETVLTIAALPKLERLAMNVDFMSTKSDERVLRDAIRPVHATCSGVSELELLARDERESMRTRDYAGTYIITLLRPAALRALSAAGIAHPAHLRRFCETVAEYCELKALGMVSLTGVLMHYGTPEVSPRSERGRLSFRAEASEYTTVHHIEPLFGFSEVTRLTLDNLHLHPTGDDYAYLAKAWPNLTHLSVYDQEAKEAHPLTALLDIARYFPDLESLQAQLNAVRADALQSCFASDTPVASRLRKLSVGMSPISADSPAHIALLIRMVFPALTPEELVDLWSPYHKEKGSWSEVREAMRR